MNRADGGCSGSSTSIHNPDSLAAQDKADLALHIALRGWTEAAEFEDVTSRNLGSRDFIELRFKRGQNEDCHDAADAERRLGYIARGMGFRIPPGDCVVEMTGDQFAAWFWWEPRPAEVAAA